MDSPISSKSNQKIDLTEDASELEEENEEDEEKRTLFCGGLIPKITEGLLYELCLHAGPIERVHIPKSKEGVTKNFGFVTFQYSCSVNYAINILENVQLFGQRVTFQTRNKNPRNDNKRQQQRVRAEDHNDQDALNAQLTQLTAAAQLGLIDHNMVYELSRRMTTNYVPPQHQQFNDFQMQNVELYKRSSLNERARRRDEREIYHRPNNRNNNSWTSGNRQGGGYNQRNDRRSEQRRSGGNYR